MPPVKIQWYPGPHPNWFQETWWVPKTTRIKQIFPMRNNAVIAWSSLLIGSRKRDKYQTNESTRTKFSHPSTSSIKFNQFQSSRVSMHDYSLQFLIYWKKYPLRSETGWCGGKRIGYRVIHTWVKILALLFISQLGKLREVTSQDQFIQHRTWLVTPISWEHCEHRLICKIPFPQLYLEASMFWVQF